MASRKKGSGRAGKPKKEKADAKKRKRSKKKSTHGSRELVDPVLMQALANPVRVRILAILVERSASPKEIGEELGESLSNVSYHIKVLHEADLIELERTIPRRGAVEHFYKAHDRTVLPNDAWDELPPAMRKGVSGCIVREFIEDASASMEAGIFDDAASDLCWTPLILDQTGVEEVGRLADEFLDAVLDVQAKATGRASNGNAEGASVSATVFLASFLSARSPEDGLKASAAKRR